jgi:hypothetical protein
MPPTFAAALPPLLALGDVIALGLNQVSSSLSIYFLLILTQ